MCWSINQPAGTLTQESDRYRQRSPPTESRSEKPRRPHRHHHFPWAANLQPLCLPRRIRTRCYPRTYQCRAYCGTCQRTHGRPTERAYAWRRADRMRRRDALSRRQAGAANRSPTAFVFPKAPCTPICGIAACRSTALQPQTATTTHNQVVGWCVPKKLIPAERLAELDGRLRPATPQFGTAAHHS